MRLPRRRKSREGKKKVHIDIDVSFVHSDTIESYLDKFSYEDKDVCLEIGDIGPKDNCLTVDVRDDADYVGDIRGCFSSDYSATDDLSRIPLGRFKIVKLIHTVEHIQWIYQDALMAWVLTLLDSGGMIYIDTPNLEYITKVYLSNLQRLEAGERVKFPGREYPNMVDDSGKLVNPEKDLQPWTNFKLYSGCSPGDFHHCMYDAYWLVRMLAFVGFEDINISSDETLKAVGFKVGDSNVSSLNIAIQNAMR